jgi:hypothetical protein
MAVYEQYRSVEAGEVSLDGLDVEITVTQPKDDSLEFEVSVWNLTDDTWSKIETGDLCRVELGWADGPVETVVLGEIDTLNRTSDGRDIEHTIAGVDETEAALKVRPKGRTWKDKRVDQIATELVSSIGLSAKTEAAGSPISGTWSATDDKTISKWLDDLIQIAANKTGVEWEWFSTAGQVHVLPRSSKASDAPKLSYGGMLSSIGEKSSTDDDTEGQLAFEAMCEPRITKGAAVAVETEQFSGGYRVSDYELSSSTVSGDHFVEGTLTPIDADYSIA